MRYMLGLILLTSLFLSTSTGVDVNRVAVIEEPSDPMRSGFDTLSFDEKLDLLCGEYLKNGEEPSRQVKLVRLATGVSQGMSSNFFTIADRANYSSNLPSNLKLSMADNYEANQLVQAIVSQRAGEAGVDMLISEMYLPAYLNGRFFEEAVHENPQKKERILKEVEAAYKRQNILFGASGFFKNIQSYTSLSRMDIVRFSGLRTYRQRAYPYLELSWDNFPQLDTVTVPFSSKIIKEYIREKQGFNGVIASPIPQGVTVDAQVLDAMQMWASGVDVVYVSPKSTKKLKEAGKTFFKRKKKLLNQKAKKVWKLIQNQSVKSEKKAEPNLDVLQFQAAEHALSCIRNRATLLPIKDLQQNFLFVGSDHSPFYKQASQYVKIKHNDQLDEKTLAGHDVVLVDGEAANFKANVVRFGQFKKDNQVLILLISKEKMMKYRTRGFESFDAVVLLSDETELSQELGMQGVFGAITMTGQVPFFISKEFKDDGRIRVSNIRRLRYTNPKYLGLNNVFLDSIDSVVQASIDAKAFPGCQVQFAWHNHVVLQKGYGKVGVNDKQEVDLSIIYDIASITKIAASTISMMHLQDRGQLNLNMSLGDFLPSLLDSHEFSTVNLRDMMAHQAGLPAWIPFYVKTLENKKPSKELYSNKETANKNLQVAEDLFILNSYKDSIYHRIKKTHLKRREYRYSDIGYYFFREMVQAMTDSSLDEYVNTNFYKPLGLQTMGYHPLRRFPLERIAPTEDDKIFRGQEVRGYVHDPGAAMLGGMCGHAGVFSNANDLSVLMQMVLNGGYYGGKRYLSEQVISEYTQRQFPETNRRAAGFDKPKLKEGGGTCDKVASMESYGHSGFTGTLTWQDPKVGVNYVFLSNRVNPDAENWQIVKLNTRTEIQRLFYKAIDGVELINYFPAANERAEKSRGGTK